MAILPININISGISQVDKLKNSINDLDKSTNKTNNDISKFSKGLKTLAIGALAYLTIDKLVSSVTDLASGFLDVSDSMSSYNSRLSLVTGGTAGLVYAQEQLLQVSNESRTSLRTSIDLYAQMARSTKELNLTSSELVDITKTIGQTLTISGTPVESANAALFQLSQAFSAGVLRGEEFNSIVEQTPRLAQAIADGLGVTTGQLRAMANEGKLTSEVVINALKSQASAINSEFSNIAINIEQGQTVLGNSIDTTISKLDKQYQVTETIGSAYASVATTIDTLFTTAFENAIGKSVDFAEITFGAISSVIEIGGVLYDTFEVIGDLFNSVYTAGKVAFYGIGWAVGEVAYSIGDSFTWVFNKVIDGFNMLTDTVISGINYLLGAIESASMGTVQLGRVDANAVQFDNITIDDVRNFADDAKQKFLTATEEYVAIQKDLWTDSSTGRDTARKMIEEFTKSFDEMRAKIGQSGSTTTPTTTPTTTQDTMSYEDLIKQGEDYLLKNAMETYSDLYTATEDSTEATQDTVEALKDYLDLFYNDDGSYYEVLNDVADTTSDYVDTIDTLNNAIDDSIDSIDTFAFQLTDVLFSSLQSNADTLRSIGTSVSNSTVTYAQALEDIETARYNLIYGTSATDNVLNTKIAETYKSAYDTFIASASDYLDMSNFSSIEEFRFAQATVGTQVSQFQQTAVESADVLDSMSVLLASINETLADGVLTDDESIALTNLASDVNTKNEQLLGSSGDVVGATNSVSEYINKLTASNGSGVAIGDIITSTGVLDVATGLETDISSISESTSDTASTNSNIASTNSSTASTNSSIASSNSSIDSKTGKIKYTTTSQSGFLDVDNNWVSTGSETTYYAYYAKGGFTTAIGEKDQTGYKVAGIVHENEWVAPEWMLNQNPALFNSLENVRQRGSFADGGYTTPSMNVNSNFSSGELSQMQKDIRDLKNIFLNITENGNIMNVKLAE